MPRVRPSPRLPTAAAPTGGVAAAAPSANRSRTLGLGLALLLGVVAALGVYMHRSEGIDNRVLHPHTPEERRRLSAKAAMPMAVPEPLTPGLRRSLAWGGDDEEEDAMAEGDDEGPELDAPGVPEDDEAGAKKGKKKKKFSFDDEIEGDDEEGGGGGDDGEEDGEDAGGDDGEEEAAPKKKKGKKPTKATKKPVKPTKKPKAMPKMGEDDGEEEDAAAPAADGEEDEEEVDAAPTKVKPKKGKAKKPAADDEEDGGDGGDGPLVIKAPRGGSSTRIAKGGSKAHPEDGKKDPLAPTLDTRDSRRYSEEAVLPGGHTINIDVPSP